MTHQSRFNRRFINNRKGYSGIIATIFMVLVVLFLVFNVQMFMLSRDAALQDTIGQSMQLEADTSVEQLMFISQSATANGNQATVSWQMKNTSPIPIELVSLWVQGSSTAYGTTSVSIVLGPGESDTSSRTVTLNDAFSGSCIFWFVTSRGNVLGPALGSQGPTGEDGADGPPGPAGQTGPQGKDGESGLVSSIKMDWLKFRYYDFGTSAPTDGAVLPTPQTGCDIPQDHYVMIAAEFTNSDPNDRTITLTSDTYVWAVDPRDNTGNGALKTLLSWPIVSIQNNQLDTTFTGQDLYVDTPTMVYFLDCMHTTPHTTTNPIPISINLYGTTATDSYGQNIPFVSIRFTQTMNQVDMLVSPPGAGTVTPEGINRYYTGDSFSVSAAANSGYKFLSWTSNASGLTVTNPEKASTTAVAGESGALTANFISVPDHFIDSANMIHDSITQGTHSSFAAMQAGPDATYDTLSEGAVYTWATPGQIGVWNGNPWIPGQDPNHKAINTIDGSTSSYWSYDHDTEHYICFDLGKNYTVTQISLYQDTSTPSNRFGYGSQASIDVYFWPYDDSNIFSKGYVTTWTSAADSGGWVNLTFSEPIEGRYIKLWEHNAYDESRQRLYEFRFQYQTHSLNLEAQFTNVANYQYYTSLNIQTGNFNSGQYPLVYYWNNGWKLLGNLTPNTLNQFAVTLTAPNFDIKLVSPLHGDPNQMSWQIDYVQLSAS